MGWARTGGWAERLLRSAVQADDLAAFQRVLDAEA